MRRRRLFITTAANKSDDISPAALKGKSIGTQSSTIHLNYLEKYYKDSEIKTYPTQDEANLDLANGRLDYVTADSLVLEEFVNTKGKGTTRFVANYPRDHGDPWTRRRRGIPSDRQGSCRHVQQGNCRGGRRRKLQEARSQILQDGYSRKVTQFGPFDCWQSTV